MLSPEAFGINGKLASQTDKDSITQSSYLTYKGDYNSDNIYDWPENLAPQEDRRN